MKINLLAAIPFFGTVFLAFNNCSKYSSSTYENLITQDPMSTSTPNTNFRATCKVNQQSGPQVIIGSNLNFAIDYSGAFEQFYYSCNNSSQIFLATATRSPITLSISPAYIGNYNCTLHGKTNSSTVGCTGQLQFSVADQFNAPPAPQSSPNPSPSPAPIPNPTPSPNPNPVGSYPQFTSVHNASLNPVKGFKNQCHPNTSSSQTFTCGGMAKDTDSGNQWIYQQKEFKIYIPKGTLVGGMKLFLPQKVRTAVVVSADKPPLRTTPLSLDEYRFDSTTGWIAGTISESEAYRNNEDDSGVGFEKLLRGQELVLVHPGGGVMQVTPTIRRQSVGSVPLEQGHWIYIRVITQEDSLYNPQYVFDIDTNIYTSWFSSAQFDSYGDPK